MAPDIETLVIGGGAVGLAIARALVVRCREVTLVERHGHLGTETSTRNSGVVHAGLYYPTGSLRAELCVRGRDLLYRFAADNGIAVSRPGKLLVATSDAEVPKLQGIAAQAARNGVVDLVALSGPEAQRLEPNVRCVAAYLSPSTGIIDAAGLVAGLEGHFLSLGGSVVLNTAVSRLEPTASGLWKIHVVSSGEASSVTARHVVNAAGHGATALSDTLPDRGYRAPRTYPAKGHYFALSGRSPFRHLIYPMPQGAWLGVHLTLDTGGRAKFGPDIEWFTDNGGGGSRLDYAFDDPHGTRRAMFEREIRRYWPGLPDGALVPDSTGIRPKIYREGETAADFVIHGEKEHGFAGLIALYGIESPGLTSSLAIGERVADMLP